MHFRVTKLRLYICICIYLHLVFDGSYLVYSYFPLSLFQNPPFSSNLGVYDGGSGCS